MTAPSHHEARTIAERPASTMTRHDLDRLVEYIAAAEATERLLEKFKGIAEHLELEYRALRYELAQAERERDELKGKLAPIESFLREHGRILRVAALLMGDSESPIGLREETDRAQLRRAGDEIKALLETGGKEGT